MLESYHKTPNRKRSVPNFWLQCHMLQTAGGNDAWPRLLVLQMGELKEICQENTVNTKHSPKYRSKRPKYRKLGNYSIFVVCARPGTCLLCYPIQVNLKRMTIFFIKNETFIGFMRNYDNDYHALNNKAHDRAVSLYMLANFQFLLFRGTTNVLHLK